jgi:hypothetical protein
MNMMMNAIEIALLLLLPLIVFYKRSAWNYKAYILIIPALYLIWYLTYGFLHEFSHMIAIWISGKEIFSWQMVPHFWKGDFGGGYVKYDFRGDPVDLFIIILPYVRDIVFLVIGYVSLKRKSIQHPFPAGLIMVLLVCSPLYDISNNYLAYILGSLNDFNAIKVSTNCWTADSIGLSFMMAALFLACRLLILSAGYPANLAVRNDGLSC